MRTLWLTFFALLLMGSVTAAYSSADAQVDSCPALIAQALASVGNTCGSLARNSACYGYHDVIASFSDATSSSSFTQPSDRVGLTTLKTINTSPMNTALAKWGIALMSLQANLPDSLPGQNTVFMLLGDTQVENAVAPDQAFTGGAVVTVTTSAPASLFYEPYTSDSPLREIPANVPLTADAVTPDGAWVRVIFNNLPGWVMRASLATADALATLPVITAQTRTPMQAFYLRTGITGTDCTQAPDLLIVQGPQNLMVDISVDGADIRLGSTIALRIVPLTAEIAARFAAVYHCHLSVARTPRTDRHRRTRRPQRRDARRDHRPDRLPDPHLPLGYAKSGAGRRGQRPSGRPRLPLADADPLAAVGFRPVQRARRRLAELPDPSARRDSAAAARIESNTDAKRDRNTRHRLRAAARANLDTHSQRHADSQRNEHGDDDPKSDGYRDRHPVRCANGHTNAI